MAESPPNFHYGRVIILTGVGVLFSCIGLGRFVLGMLLPSMGAVLHLTYSQMGAISTANLIGYLGGIIPTDMVSRKIGARHTVTIGLILVGGSMAVISRAAGFHELLICYTVTGIGSALANVPLIGLSTRWFHDSIRGKASGTILIGNALAIVFSGIFIPLLTRHFGPSGWRPAWGVMGGIALVTAVLSALLLRNSPAEMGLLPLGTPPDATPPSPPSSLPRLRHLFRRLFHLGVLFALFGATQVVYATFIVTSLVREQGIGESSAGLFWTVVGAFSLFSGRLFGRLSDALGRRAGIMIAYGCFTLAYLLAAAGASRYFLYLSIVLFGLSMWSIPTIMYAAAGDVVAPSQAGTAIGYLTFFCGIGQILGPAVAGVMADASGSFHLVFGLCAAVSVSAILLAAFLKRPTLLPSAEDREFFV